MDNWICSQIIEEFTAPQALDYFKKELEKCRQIPFMELVERASSYYDKLERQHEHAYDYKVTKFNHQVETRFIVKQYAYAGAMELNDPSSSISVEEVYVQFINAYNALKQERCDSCKEVEHFCVQDNVLLAIIDQTDQYGPQPEDFLMDEFGQEYLVFLANLSPIEAAMVDALLCNPTEKSHKTIAYEMHMDPALFSRRLKVIREKLKEAL